LPKNLYYRIFKFAEKKIDKSFACSHGLNDFHEKGGLVEKGQMEVIEHGFNYNPPPDRMKDYKFGSPQLVLIGRIIKLKGHDFVLEMLTSLKKDYPNIKFVIVGSGIYEDTLKENVKRLELEEQVHFAGFQRNVMDYLASSDIVMVPSYTESMPVVILEGFNSKNPVVAFETIGCRDIIDHNETGILVPAYDTKILEQEVRRLIEHKEERDRLANNAYEKLNSYYTLKRMTEETIDFFKRHLNK
ncbi:MAG: glycosyltransferase, partial [Bacteroidota bacterium]